MESFQIDLLRAVDNNDWLIVSLIALAIAYVGTKVVYGRYWRRYRQALLFGQESVKLIQEKNVLMFQAAISLNVLASFSIGMFLYLLVDNFELLENMPNNFLGWMLSVLFVALFFGGKYLFNELLGRFGDNKKASAMINHQWLINYKNFGFFLFPISVVVAFVDPPLDDYVLYAGLVALLIMLVMNYIKGFAVLFQHRISIYYGILYLCTLEILPVLIVWKGIRL